ncbi:MAG: sterol desaturase family protein [Myxococcales bacterium]|nr:sterol desaturase family protein [Myxococcales bacterium]
MSLFWMLILVLLLSGLTMLVTKLAYHWSPLASARIHPEPGRKLRGAKLYPRVFGNMIFAGGLVLTFTFTLESWLVDQAPRAWTWIVLHGALVLLVYDFFYYLLHRFAFHEWALLRRVHVVHHRVRHPHSVDSLYLHPAENFLGLALLFGCMVLLGPLHPLTFIGVVGTHSLLNILVHSGLDLPFFPFRVLSFLARKHDLHHVSMKGGNYASLTPIFDRLFGTAE